MLITSSNTEAQQLSNYTFTLNLYAVISIPQGANILITFPDDYESLAMQDYDCPTITWP